MDPRLDWIWRSEPLLLLASSLPFLLGRRASDREKTLAVAAAWGGLFLSMGAHWLVRFLGPGWFPAYGAGGILFTVGFLWPSLRALQELWGGRERPGLNHSLDGFGP